MANIAAQAKRVNDLIKSGQLETASERVGTILVMSMSRVSLPREGSDAE
jgi:hypothetical protein